MTRRPALVTQAEVERAIRAARAQGVQIGAVEVEGRLVRIVAANDDAKPPQKPSKGLGFVP